MTAELAARRTAAVAVLADFHAATTGRQDADWHTWSLRLAQHLQLLSDELGLYKPSAPFQPAASYVAADGGCWLTAADLATVRDALSGIQDWCDGETRVRVRSLEWRLGADG